MADSKPQPAKRPYSTPKLTRFGTLAEYTAAVGNMGGSDGGSASTQKTHRKC